MTYAEKGIFEMFVWASVTVGVCACAGRQVEGVWHTAVVVFGREYFYGGGGIAHCAPVSRRTRSTTLDSNMLYYNS